MSCIELCKKQKRVVDDNKVQPILTTEKHKITSNGKKNTAITVAVTPATAVGDSNCAEMADKGKAKVLVKHNTVDHTDRKSSANSNNDLVRPIIMTEKHKMTSNGKKNTAITVAVTPATAVGDSNCAEMADKGKAKVLVKHNTVDQAGIKISANSNSDEGDLLHVRLEGAGQGADLDCECKAVMTTSDGDVVYECSYEAVKTPTQTSTVTGKFSMNVPYSYVFRPGLFFFSLLFCLIHGDIFADLCLWRQNLIFLFSLISLFSDNVCSSYGCKMCSTPCTYGTR